MLPTASIRWAATTQPHREEALEAATDAQDATRDRVLADGSNAQRSAARGADERRERERRGERCRWRGEGRVRGRAACGGSTAAVRRCWLKPLLRRGAGGAATAMRHEARRAAHRAALRGASHAPLQRPRRRRSPVEAGAVTAEAIQDSSEARGATTRRERVGIADLANGRAPGGLLRCKPTLRDASCACMLAAVCGRGLGVQAAVSKLWRSSGELLGLAGGLVKM